MSCKIRCGLSVSALARRLVRRVRRSFAWWEVKIEGVLYTQIGGWRQFIVFRAKGVGGRSGVFAIYVEWTQGQVIVRGLACSPARPVDAE